MIMTMQHTYTEKVGLRFNIQKTKIMAGSPITSWQIDGETVNSGWLYFGGSKITEDGDCSHEIKGRLLLGRKVMTNLDSISPAFLPGEFHGQRSLVGYSPRCCKESDTTKVVTLRWLRTFKKEKLKCTKTVWCSVENWQVLLKGYREVKTADKDSCLWR